MESLGDRRQGDRRKAQLPFIGEDRRKEERRSGLDRRSAERRTTWPTATDQAHD